MASHWHSYGSSVDLDLWTTSRWANGVSDNSTKLSSFWEVNNRNISHFSQLFVDGGIAMLKLGISGTIYGSGNTFLSPSQMQLFARCPTPSLSGCSVLLPHHPSSLSWAASALHVHPSITPHISAFLSCVPVQSDPASHLALRTHFCFTAW